MSNPDSPLSTEAATAVDNSAREDTAAESTIAASDEIPFTGADRPAAGGNAGTVATEARRRRSFAVISHPDAGKSTVTEALALHARAIAEAGTVTGKTGRRHTVSD